MIKMVIWKYTLDQSTTILRVPQDGIILNVQLQNSRPVIWMLVDKDKGLEERRFITVGTGVTIHHDCYHYIGTVQLYDSTFVLHVFEDKS